MTFRKWFYNWSNVNGESNKKFLINKKNMQIMASFEKFNLLLFLKQNITTWITFYFKQWR